MFVCFGFFVMVCFFWFFFCFVSQFFQFNFNPLLSMISKILYRLLAIQYRIDDPTVYRAQSHPNKQQQKIQIEIRNWIRIRIRKVKPWRGRSHRLASLDLSRQSAAQHSNTNRILNFELIQSIIYQITVGRLNVSPPDDDRSLSIKLNNCRVREKQTYQFAGSLNFGCCCL